jgi:NMD protein affecting ribosome stability and mRNA decay
MTTGSAKQLCPDCGTAELTYGRKVCQACAVVRSLSADRKAARP